MIYPSERFDILLKTSDIALLVLFRHGSNQLNSLVRVQTSNEQIGIESRNEGSVAKLTKQFKRLIIFFGVPANVSDRHYSADIIMIAFRYYLTYKLNYRDIEEIFAEPNIHFDHSTLNRWVIKYASLLEARFRKKNVKSLTHGGWMKHT